ncbi:MAG TPA: hypothetical protein VG053_01440 [Solirubrobacteraceae bacterium]|nr:hypothetical protein [Solirubrobacteraceae bacterium]
MAPVAATATAGALLLEPATNAFGQAQWPQVVGLVVGIVGLLLVFVEGVYLLAGADIKGVQPELLYDTAKADGGPLSTKPGLFHLEAAADLGGVWKENSDKLKRVARLFRVFVIGLVLELAGLGVAALIRPSRTHQAMQPQAAASLHLISGRLSTGEMSIAGEIAAGAQGRVRIAVSLLGRTGEVMSLHPSIHNGRFSVRIRAAGDLAPLRSASYTITWAGSSSVASAYLVGTIARCPGDCQ